MLTFFIITDKCYYQPKKYSLFVRKKHVRYSHLTPSINRLSPLKYSFQNIPELVKRHQSINLSDSPKKAKVEINCTDG
jgi:hypothetical protein